MGVGNSAHGCQLSSPSLPSGLLFTSGRPRKSTHHCILVFSAEDLALWSDTFPNASITVIVVTKRVIDGLVALSQSSASKRGRKRRRGSVLVVQGQKRRKKPGCFFKGHALLILDYLPGLCWL